MSADGGSRTHTSLRPQVFETCASASSATSAELEKLNNISYTMIVCLERLLLSIQKRLGLIKIWRERFYRLCKPAFRESGTTQEFAEPAHANN